MDLEGLRECALLLEEEDMLMEPSAKPLFLVEDIMPERDRFIGCCWGCGIYFGSVVLMYVWVMFQMELDLFCGMFFRSFGRLFNTKR